MSWEDLSDWWVDEVESDPEYEATVTPLVVDLLGDVAGQTVLDVGCGEGRIMRVVDAAGGEAVGVDISPGLLRRARRHGPVLRWSLPGLDCIADASVDGAVVSLVLEHLVDEETFLTELGRVVRRGGALVLVANHPIFTAPESAPIEELDETTWRPGRYFGRGHTDEQAGEGTIRFHHRTMADLLTSASVAGWDLDRLVEVGAPDSLVAAHPTMAAQRHIPRLMGARWRRR